MNPLIVLAYLDPGAGSLLLQALVGGGAGLIVFVRHVWRTWRLDRSVRNIAIHKD